MSGRSRFLRMRTPVTAGLRDQFDIPLFGLVLQLIHRPGDVSPDLLAGVSRIVYVLEHAQRKWDRADGEARMLVLRLRREIDAVIESGNQLGVYRFSSAQALLYADAVEQMRREIARMSVEQLYMAQIHVEAAMASLAAQEAA